MMQRKSKQHLTKRNKTIIAKQAGKLTVTVDYLTTAGKTYKANLNLVFTYAAEKAEINDMIWVVNADRQESYFRNSRSFC